MQKSFIIVLNWNGYTDTAECLRSIEKGKKGTDLFSLEVVVVDNGSTDGSVERLKKDFKDVVYIENKENLGYTGGNNVGIMYAIGKGAEYIWLLNNDTTVKADTLTRLVEAAGNDPRAGLLGPKILQMDNPERAYAMIGRLNMWFPWPDRMEGEDESKVTGEAVCVDFLSGSALLVKREFVERVGLLDERFFFYWEENDWCERGRKVILTVHQFLPEYYSGTELLTYETAKELQRRGHSVEVWTGYPADQVIAVKQPTVTYEYDGISVHRYNHNNDFPFPDKHKMEAEYNNTFIAGYFNEY